MPNLALSKCWAGSVGAKYSYSASKPADAGWVCSAWYSHAFKNCPTNPSSGHAAAIQGKGRPLSLMNCSQTITSCITGIYSGSSRVTGLTYLQFKRENSQMTKEAMFHSHMLSYSFPLEIQLFEGQGLLRRVSSSSLLHEDRIMCSVALHPRWWKETLAKWKQVNQLNTSALIWLQGDGVTRKTV